MHPSGRVLSHRKEARNHALSSHPPQQRVDEHLDYNIGGYDLIFVARGMTPRLKSWQLSSVVAKLFAQAGLPDKAKRPDAPPPATVPPARRAQAEKPDA